MQRTNPDLSSDAPAANAFLHTAVLLNETVAAALGVDDLDGLDRKADGVFVDATFGRGGHSRLLLEYLSAEATLLVFDKDPQAIKAAQALAATDRRVIVAHDSFARLGDRLKKYNLGKARAILADLGVSSPQLDDASRGFSFMRDGAIDMRMNNSQGQTVGQWLETVDEKTLADTLYEYGEERHSRRIARAIKQMERFDSTLLLAETIKKAHPAWQKGKHPATQSFQALRILINNELGDLDALLAQSVPCLEEGGRLAIIGFHSLEDRRVKRFLQKHSRGRYDGDERLPFAPPRPMYFDKPLRVRPSDGETQANVRAKSAVLRFARRTRQAWQGEAL